VDSGTISRENCGAELVSPIIIIIIISTGNLAELASKRLGVKRMALQRQRFPKLA